MHLFRVVSLVVLVVLLSLAAALDGSDAHAQTAPLKLTVSYSAAGGQYINLFVAKEFGIFQKHGLDVTLN